MGNRGAKQAKLGFCSFSPAEQLQRGRDGSASMEKLFLGTVWHSFAQNRWRSCRVKLCQRHPKSKGEMKFFVSNKVDAWEEEQLKHVNYIFAPVW
jgi:hypothetical protein